MTIPSVKNSLKGAILLVTGCCIGAGMLGLPLVTLATGFFPSCLLFLIAWGFMFTTGLLLLEANTWFPEKINLLTLAEKTLGKPAKYLVALLFIFLFYCLMVAYLGSATYLLGDLGERVFNYSFSYLKLTTGLILVLSLVVFLGTSVVDQVNRFFMFLLIISYLSLVIFGSYEVKFTYLSHYSLASIEQVFPAMIISFGFHNLIPSLRQYLQGDTKKVKQAIFIGSLIPLVLYIIWDGIILGLIPANFMIAKAIDKGAFITTLLKQTTTSYLIKDCLDIFSFCAIVTSFITISLSFVDFLADGLNITKKGFSSFYLVCLTNLPPFLFSLSYPYFFLTALNYAGAFGAVMLFGLIPVIIVWRGRYYQKRSARQLVPGGKKALACIGLVALLIFFIQVKIELGL